MEPNHWRQMDFYNPKNNHSVLIVGAGSIGSYVAFGLARMGVKDITVVDFDTVASHNLPNQFFSESLPDEEETILKVNALSTAIKLIMPNKNISIHPMKIENFLENNESNHYNAIFTLVDCMNVRKFIYSFLKHRAMFADYLIDARVGGEYANVFSIPLRRNSARTFYESTLWSNSDSEELPCTGRSVIDVTFCVAGECIGRFRAAMNQKLRVYHTFHSYNIGSSVIFAKAE